VLDFVDDKVFQTDARGELIEKKGQRPPRHALPPPVAVSRSATRAEPRLATWWLFPAALLLLALAAVAWLIRKRAQAAASA
jgi:hypothetical protein